MVNLLTRKPFQGLTVNVGQSVSQGFKANPGLKLANTFGVKPLTVNVGQSVPQRFKANPGLRFANTFGVKPGHQLANASA